MPDLESIVLELDPRSVQKAIVQSNKDVEDWEKGVVGAGERMQKSLERMGEMLIKMNDRSYNSMERLTQSIERQAAAYGKTRVDRLVADRDRFIKKLGDEQGMIERVTKAYQRMIEIEEQRPPGGGEGGSGGTGFNMRYAFFGVKDIMEGRTKFALAEAANEMMRLRGAALAVGGTVAGITALGFAIYELKKYTEEAAEAPYKLAAAFEELRAPLKQANDELRLTNDRLRNQIATLEHRAPNKLAEMLDEASIAADKLASFLEKDSRALTKLLGEQKVGAVAQFLGEAGIEDIRKMFGGVTGYGGHDAEIARINRAFQAKVDAARKARDLKASDSAVEEWKKQLEPLRKQETDTLNKALADSKQAQYRHDIASAFNIGDPYQVGALASRILGGQDQTKRREIIEYIQGQLQERWTHIDEQIENTRLERRKQEIAPPKGQNEFESALAHRRESVKSYQAELDALRHAQADKELSDFGQFEADIAKLEAASQNEVAENHRKYAAVGAKQLAQLDAATKEDYSLQIAIAYTKELQKQGEELNKQADLWRQRGAELDRSLNKTFEDEVNAGLKKNQKAAEDIIKSGKEVATARRAHVGRMSTENEQFSARVIRMQSGRTPEDQARADMIAAAVEMAGERERIEKQIAEIQADGVKTLGEKSKEIAELRMTEEERLQKFQEEGVLRLMQLQKQRFDEVASKAETLSHTLFTNPRSFGKELETTVRDAALKPFERRIGDLVATVLVGKPQPMDAVGATNSNTQATLANTAAMRDLTAIVQQRGGAQAAIPAVGGGSTLAQPWMLGAPNFTPGLGFGFPSIAEAGATEQGSTTAYTLPSGLINRTGEAIGGVPSIPAPSTPPFPPSSGGNESGGWQGQIFGGGTNEQRGGGFGGLFGGFGDLGNLKGMLGIGKSFPKIGTLDETPAGMDTGQSAAGAGGTSVSSVMGSPVAGMAGMMLARYGLFGSQAGTPGGIAMGAVGGILLGMQYGGPVGAAVGALAGLGAGIGEMLAGVETPENEAKRLVKQYYHISIDTNTARQIASIAQQKYANHVSIAVRSPEVRQMLGLYAAGTGQSQNALLSSMTPHGGSLVEQGGRLYQEATYQYGAAYAFQSKLPIYGGVSTAGYYPTPSSSGGTMLMQVSVEGKGSGDYMAGNVFTANYVQDRWADAAGASDGRVGNSAIMNDPGLIIA